MSDDLVKRLRDPAFGTETTERNLMNTAASRIEELEKERDRQYDENVHRIAEQAKAEAKLEKAVEALRLWKAAYKALAELKGEGHE